MKLSFFLAPVQAGFPSPADDFVDKKLDLNELLIAHPSATFFVRVEGHSMKDAQIYDGDVLIVDRSLQAESGSIAVAIINGEFTVKRVLKKKDRLFLVAENPAFSPLEISPEMDFQIWGIVTYVIHKVRVNRL
jgi:DNA polymerase V